MKFVLIAAIIFLPAVCQAQSTYQDSIVFFHKNYIDSHAVVRGEDKKHLSFFDATERFRVVAQFQRAQKAQWFEMPTSGKIKKIFRLYGTLTFTINDTIQQLSLYQSQGSMAIEQYRNHLFLPFTDATTGKETYESGRYIDLQTSEIVNNQVVLDFNKAYNPYCAYVAGRYNCPIPPPENHLLVAIHAGERVYAKK